MPAEPNNNASEPQILGGNIELAGFRELDGGSMIVLKKIIGNYARRFTDNYGSEKLLLRLDRLAGSFVLTGTATRKGQDHTADHSDKNLFFLIDIVLKKLEEQLGK
jgi:hypothetical protein